MQKIFDAFNLIVQVERMPEKPFPLNILKAKMAAKGIKVGQLAKKVEMPQSTVSQILNGHWIDPVRLAKLKAQIERYPGPTITVQN